MKRVTCEVRPDANDWPEGLHKDAAGAFVECWINYRDEDGATALARHYLGRGWVIVSRLEASSVRKSDLRKKRDVRSWREAKKHGYSITFNLWKQRVEKQFAA